MSIRHICWATIAVYFALVTTTSVSAQDPWPSPVVGHKSLEPGEHPRLLFRKSDLPALRARAKTPEGKAILKRLRFLLNGSDGETMTTVFSPAKKAYALGGRKSIVVDKPGAYTISHAAGYGFLYQLTGDKKYAELGKRCFEKAFDGIRDRDDRYSWKDPGGALRAGPSIGWYALGYDLCYDGWDKEFRKKVARAFENYREGRFRMDLEYLVRGMRHFPESNHWGMQVGGGALAVLALTGDPEIKDQTGIEKLLKSSQQSMIRNLVRGFGNGGYFAEGDGTGSMASHIVFLTALQGWKNAMGLDYISPRPNARWTALKYFFLTIPRRNCIDKLQDCFPCRGGYPHNVWDRDGISGAGYCSIGYGAVRPKERAAILWFYHEHLKDHDAKNKTPWDTPSPYPHHAILAFVNTPFDMKPVNPAKLLPRFVRDSRYGFYGFRNRWKDENDIVISQLARRTPNRFAHGPDEAMWIWHHGKREKWGSIPGKVSYWRPFADGSAILGGEGQSIGIDFSGASGVDGMIVLTGKTKHKGVSVTAGGVTYQFKFLTSGQSPTPRVDGNRVVVGKQIVSMKDGKLVLAQTAGESKND